MRLLFLLLIFSTIQIVAFTIVNSYNAPSDYINALNSFLSEAYNTYINQTGYIPSLCPGFYVEVKDLKDAGAYSYIAYSGGRVCVQKMEFDSQLSTIWLRHLAFHEMAHALQATFYFKDSDKWYIEALPEGLASYLNAKYYGIDWRGYGWVQDYFLKQLYRKNPYDCKPSDLCSYRYGAFFAYISEKYGLKIAVDIYRNGTVNSYYTQFLLLPWSWGREPYLLDWPTCKDSELPPYSLLYCYYDHNYDDYIAEVRVPQQVMVNGLALPRLLKLAFVNNLTTTYSYIDPTVYFTNCPSNYTVTVTSTVTHIENRTVTVTVTVPVTVTTTVPITITQIANRTVTTTVTVPTTITHVENRTITVTRVINETETETITTTITRIVNRTVAITTTTTVVQPVTITKIKNNTITTTSVITETKTTTLTFTVTQPVTITQTVNRTVTTTEIVREIDWNSVIILIIIVAVLVCLACRFGRYGKET